MIPRGGIDPERCFVCDEIKGGRRNNDGTIHWNNYGTHPPVVVKLLEQLMNSCQIKDRTEFVEKQMTDTELTNLIMNNEKFRGAIIWVVGHPDRWGSSPRVNSNGMVLGEHVRFVLPEITVNGSFLLYDPETGLITAENNLGVGRDLFNNRTVCIYEEEKPL